MRKFSMLQTTIRWNKEYLNKWKDNAHDWMFNVVQVTNSPQIVPQIKNNLKQNPDRVVTSWDYTWKGQGTRTGKTNFENEELSWKTHITWS